MDYEQPTLSPLTNIPEEYRTIAARYADRRGRAGGMANLGIGSGMSNSIPEPYQPLYPGTSKLRGGLLASLITSPDLDPNYVQRFQHIAIITQLADALISVAQATGKCIVPVDFDPNSYVSPEDCSCEGCSRKRSKNQKSASICGTTESSVRDDEKREQEGDNGANGDIAFDVGKSNNVWRGKQNSNTTPVISKGKDALGRGVVEQDIGCYQNATCNEYYNGDHVHSTGTSTPAPPNSGNLLPNGHPSIQQYE